MFEKEYPRHVDIDDVDIPRKQTTKLILMLLMMMMMM